MTRLIFCLSILSILNRISAKDASNIQFDIKTDTPIIGVLAQEIAWSLDAHWPGIYNSYIAASYVKFIEGGGARVIPIWYVFIYIFILI